jgi:hypothetical protein
MVVDCKRAGMSFSFALSDDSNLIPHLSIMQGVFRHFERAIASLESLEKSKISPRLEVLDVSIWATKILFLNFKEVDWLKQLHQQAFDLWIPISERVSADPQKFQGITPGQQASFDRTGYPFALDQYLPHITLAHLLGNKDNGATLAVLSDLLSKRNLRKVELERLVVFKVEPLGACREIVREWRL